MPQYRLIESNLQSIPSEVTNQKIDIDWPKVEQMVGSKISPEVKIKYEQACSGKSFKVFAYLTLFSKIASIGALWFATKYVLNKDLSATSITIWTGLLSVMSINYLYTWWFIDKKSLKDIDKETGEEIVYENDIQPNVDVPKAKSKLSSLWASVVASDSKWKWLMIVLLIMIAALLCKYINGIITENQYRKQLKKIKRLSEQDAAVGKSNMPDVEQLMKMNPAQAQKVAQDFVSVNNLTNGKQFAGALKSAVNADMNRNKAIVEKVKEENPQQYEQMAQETKSTNGQSFFDAATERYKNVLKPGALLTNIAFTAVFCATSGPIGILTSIVSFTIPNLLISGIGGMSGIIYMAAMIGSGWSGNQGFKGFIGKSSANIKTAMVYIGVGLACACAIRWLFNFLVNPKKNAKKPLVNKVELNKELGGDVAAKAAQNAKQGQPQTTTESYIYENTLYLSEGVISFIKEKIVNFFKSTWKCLKAVVSHPGINKGFKIVISLLAIGFIVAAGYVGATAIKAGGA